MPWAELGAVIGGVLTTIGYVRGRLNGLVATVAAHEERIKEMEKQYATCKARLEAQG